MLLHVNEAGIYGGQNKIGVLAHVYHVDLILLNVLRPLFCVLSLRSEARLASYLIGRWGRPCGARTSDHVIAPATDHATLGGPSTKGGEYTMWP